MTAWILAGWILMAVAVLAALSILFFLLSGRNAHSTQNNFRNAYTPTRYRPMARLVSESDYEFLRTHPGYRPEIGSRYRKSRRRVLRMYIQQLKQDFRSLHTQARLLLASSEATAAETHLLWELLRQRMVFERRIALLEVRMLLALLGFELPNIGPLLEMMDAMRLHLSQLGYSQAV